MAWWYLSFCDPEKPKSEQFLGACVINAATMTQAVTESHYRGLNPGGEVAIVEIPATREEIEQRGLVVNKLLSIDEIKVKRPA